jgi:hypothetical protein
MVRTVEYGIKGDDVRRLGVIRVIEQQQLDAGSRTRVQAEVDTVSSDRRP